MTCPQQAHSYLAALAAQTHLLDRWPQMDSLDINRSLVQAGTQADWDLTGSCYREGRLSAQTAIFDSLWQTMLWMAIVNGSKPHRHRRS